MEALIALAALGGHGNDYAVADIHPADFRSDRLDNTDTPMSLDDGLIDILDRAGRARIAVTQAEHPPTKGITTVGGLGANHCLVL